MEYYLTKDELYHHGILGQKWGVRRFQNPDGSLTAEGKLRYRLDSKTGKYVKLSRKERKAAVQKQKTFEKARKAAEQAKRNKSPRDKKINELTNKQLDKYIERMQKEQRALQLKADINRLDPKPVSKGEQFIRKLWNQTIEPALLNQGRQYLEKLIKDAMNAQDNAKKKEADAKQKEFDEAKRDSQYWSNKWNAEKQKQAYEELIKEREEREKNKDKK